MSERLGATKRALKLAASVVFLGAVRMRDKLRKVLGKTVPGTCVVLYYHAVRAEERRAFANQMEVLIGCAKPLKAENRTALESGRHHAAVLFHDAFSSVCDNALPEMAKRNVPCTLFVPSGYIGKRQGWITDENHRDYHETVVSADRLKSLDKKLVSIGTHTVTHADLSLLSEEAAATELQQSKAALEAVVGRPVELFAFPYGGYNSAVTEISKKLGYRRTFNIRPVLAFHEPSEYVTGSCPVSPNDWRLEFKLKLLGAYRWLAPVYKAKRRVIGLAARWIPSAHFPAQPVAKATLGDISNTQGLD